MTVLACQDTNNEYCALQPFENGDEHGDYRDRIARLEDIVEALATAQTSLAKELTAARESRTSNGQLLLAEADPDVRASSEALSDEDANLTNKRLRPASTRGIEREELFHAERRTEGIDEDEDGRKVPGSSLEASGNPLEGGLTTEGDAFFGALALPSVSRSALETEINGQKLELGAHLPRFPASFKIARLVSEGGATTNVVAELMDLLPPRSVTDGLLILYFRDINNTRLPIHEGTFRQSYDALMSFKWGRAKEEVGDDGARHVPFLAFLFILLAIAKRNEPEESATEEEAKKGAMQLYHACRKTIHVATYIRVDHIDLVLAHMFAARFLITCRQSAESWNMLGSAIRAAQAIGLHRDGGKLGLDAATTERRRRLWSLLFYLDKSTSILLGRPPAIQTQHCDTLAPSDVDVDTMPRTAVAGPPRWAEPGTPPGVFSFVAIRHSLTVITGKIAEHFQNLSQPRSYSDVVRLDGELEAFRAALPAPYRTEDSGGIDKSFDAICAWLPLHRYLISVEYHYIRCTLHRPYLLRNSERYALSRNAAFASARADRRVRQEYRKDVAWPRNRARKRHMGGLYRLFSSTLITGIELLLDPTAADAAELRACLDEFIEKHNRRAEKDQCSKREVAIIELFRQKARDPGWCARKGAKRAANAHASAGNTETATPSRPARPDRQEMPEGSTRTAITEQQRRAYSNERDGNLATGSVAPHSTEDKISVTPPGTGLPNLNVTASFNQQELAQSIFDTLGGGIDPFGLGPSIGRKNESGEFSAVGSSTFNADLQQDVSSVGTTSNGNLYESLWGSSGIGQTPLTPTFSSSQNHWPPPSAFAHIQQGPQHNNGSHLTALTPASNHESRSLSGMDWSADSLMPWGAMIEAIANQKPGHSGSNGNGQNQTE